MNLEFYMKHGQTTGLQPGRESKYGLASPHELLTYPPIKFGWKRLANRYVDRYRTEKIKSENELYPSLQYMSTSSYACGKQYPLVVQRVRNQQEIPRVRLKLKVVTGTYILQVNRSSFNKKRIYPLCLLCQEGRETFLP